MKISSYYSSRRKKIFDILISVTLLVILSPLLLLLSFLIVILDGRPILFKQTRYGLNKKVFTLYKFRTMKNGASSIQIKLKKVNEAPFPMFKMSNDPRFTRIGRYLSNLGIDEIPQLVNILKNEMSLIGPRPLPLHEAERLDSSWDFRYQVKPGILSEWALSPRRHVSLAAWQQLERDGIRTGSIANDISLLAKSLYIIIVKKIATKVTSFLDL